MRQRQEMQRALLSKLEETLAEVRTDDQWVIPSVLGMLMNRRKSYDQFTTDNLAMDELVDSYTAATVGPLANNLLRLHQYLVSSGATAGAPLDFGHADRYGAAFSNAEWKSMALKTQNYTYMVVLQPATTFSVNLDDPVIESWAVHIRICTLGRYSYDCCRVDFQSLEFLSEYDAVYPEIGYGKNTNPYFSYKDGRDQGYLCSVVPELIGGQYSTEDTLGGASSLYLGGVLYDLGCHCSCLPK